MSCTLTNMSGSPGNIQHCAVSYNTSCKLTVQLNSDKYDVFYDYDFPNSRGMRHCPKIVNIIHLFLKKKKLNKCI